MWNSYAPLFDKRISIIINLVWQNFCLSLASHWLETFWRMWWVPGAVAGVLRYPTFENESDAQPFWFKSGTSRLVLE